MAFSDFAYPDVLRQFGLTFANADDLFAGVTPVPPSQGLALVLPTAVRLASAVSTEKARSEWMIAPVLVDLWARYHGRIGVYSGAELRADPDAGLTGVLDFVICRSPQQMLVTPPAVVVVEAKRENIADGLGQCIAGMVGARRLNAREGLPADPLYGCVTTGSVWRFLRLSCGTVTLDLTEYTITQADRLLGILTYIVGPDPGSDTATAA